MRAIPIARIRFASATQEGPGFTKSSLTSVDDPDNGKNKRHRIEFHPWVNSFWIEYYEGEAGNSRLHSAGYVTRNPGDWWTPVDGPVPSPGATPIPRSPKSKAKAKKGPASRTTAKP